MKARKNNPAGILCLAAGATIALAIPAEAGVIFFFNDPGGFGTALANAGKVSKGSWNFKPDFLDAGTVVPVDDGLNIDTHQVNAPGVWYDGFTDLWPGNIDNVTFSSNATPQGPLTAGAGLQYGQFENSVLFTARKGNSFDIISGPPAGANHTAMGIEFMAFNNPQDPFPPVFHITVYDKNDLVKGKFVTAPLNYDRKFFIGILMTDGHTIGRVDIWDINRGFEGISGIELYIPIPAPATLALMGLAGLVGFRRRRS